MFDGFFSQRLEDKQSRSAYKHIHRNLVEITISGTILYVINVKRVGKSSEMYNQRGKWPVLFENYTDSVTQERCFHSSGWHRSIFSNMAVMTVIKPVFESPGLMILTVKYDITYDLIIIVDRTLHVIKGVKWTVVLTTLACVGRSLPTNSRDINTETDNFITLVAPFNAIPMFLLSLSVSCIDVWICQ